jgi:PEGA domain-containing protein
MSVSLACVVAVLAPRRADAATEQQRVAIVRLTFEGVSEAARELFAERLAEGLAAAQFKVVPRSTVRERLAAAGVAADLSGCRDAACLARVATALKVDFMVVASITGRDKSYEITLDLVNGQSGSSMGVGRERCEICGIEEASEKVGLAASALRARLEALAQTPARFVIRSRPAGARVTVDGEKIGRTPVDHELSAGVHKLSLAAEGYDALERTVTAIGGVDETLDLDMVPLPTKFPYRLAGWSALVVGVAAIAGGVWALKANDTEVGCSDADKMNDLTGKHCPQVWDFRAAGGILIGLGAAAGTLGGTWIYFGTVGVSRPGEGGTPPAGVTVSGRF